MVGRILLYTRFPSKFGQLDLAAVSVVHIVIGDSSLVLQDVEDHNMVTSGLFCYSLAAIANGIVLHAMIRMVSTSMFSVINGVQKEKEYRNLIRALINANWIEGRPHHNVSARIGLCYFSSDESDLMSRIAARTVTIPPHIDFHRNHVIR